MNLILYSGGKEENIFLNSKVAQLWNDRPIKILFIPSEKNEEEFYLEQTMDVLTGLKIKSLEYFYCDESIIEQEKLKLKLKECDLVFLSGGNTFYFLKHLKKSGCFGLLKDYAQKGGFLAGLSAGAIIMTPQIQTASFPDFDCDDNDVDLKNLNSMGLVEFSFFPHYTNSRRYIHSLNLNSRFIHNPIYAAADGSGIIINSGMQTFIGDIWGFFRGKKFKVVARSSSLNA